MFATMTIESLSCNIVDRKNFHSGKNLQSGNSHTGKNTLLFDKGLCLSSKIRPNKYTLYDKVKIFSLCHRYNSTTSIQNLQCILSRAFCPLYPPTPHPSSCPPGVTSVVSNVAICPPIYPSSIRPFMSDLCHACAALYT